MLQNAVPILESLNTLSHQAEDPKFGEVIRLCCEKIESGVEFSRCIAYFPGVFPPIYKTMVQIGQQTGSLDVSLDRLALWLERDDALRQRLRSAMTYPAFVMGLATAMTLGIFYWIMPTFVAIFQDMKIELPWITSLMMLITNCLRNPPAVLIGLSLMVFMTSSFRKWVAKPAGRSQFYRMCLRVPVLGDMLSFGSLARYCSGMEALLSTGMDIASSLKLSAAASGNPLLEQDAAAMIESVVSGNPVAEHMRQHPDIYPTTLRNMVGSGEEVSRLPEMFGRTATFYDLEMNFKVDALGAALEPVMLGSVSIVVATIVLSIFLPLYSYITKLGE